MGANRLRVERVKPFDVEIDWPVFFAALAIASADDPQQVVRKAALPWQYVGVIRRRRPIRRNPAAFLKMCRAFQLDPLSFLADTTLWRAAQCVPGSIGER